MYTNQDIHPYLMNMILYAHLIHKTFLLKETLINSFLLMQHKVNILKNKMKLVSRFKFQCSFNENIKRKKQK